MKGIGTKSLIVKTGVIYLLLTVLNISIFILMVFENQLDLISENAILNSQNKGTSLKYHIDNVLKSGSSLSKTVLKKIGRDAMALGITDLIVFSESGRIFMELEDNKLTDRENANSPELRMINMAITKQGFEDKLFYHSVHKKEKTIDLYIPFTYEIDKIGVAAINLEMKDIDRQMSYLYKQCLLIIVLVMVLHIGFAVLFWKMILFPLKKLNRATESIAQGDLDIRVDIVRDDEIGQLALSFNEMSTALQRMRDEARGSNPLTSLPGNISIARYIDENLVKGNLICVLYCDLDNFKAYNDKYGFTKGDEAILYTRDCLLSAAKQTGKNTIFIGHEGGDDFVVVSPYQYWEQFAKVFISTFDREISQFYNNTDARNGYIESVNRNGQHQRFPLISVSIAVVTNKTRVFRRHAEMIRVAAEVKKYVKSMDGSCYAIDRRTAPVSPTARIHPSKPPQRV
jgi:diguanylate cyclase (GGDEF)-like protein